MKVIFKNVFYSNIFYKFITLKFKNSRTRFWFKQLLEFFFVNFRIEGHEFDYVEEMDTITVVVDRHRTYKFYMKHIMCAFEWMINKKLEKTNLI